MTSEVLAALREAGRVAAAARDWGARLIRPGASLREATEAIEDEIRRLGGELAFPVQSSRNEVAAHYCAGPEDPTLYQAGDLAKLDIGVHVDGWVVDTAVSVSVGEGPGNQALIAAAEAALAAAIAAVRPGVEVRSVSTAIEAAIVGRGLRPMQNLCGHGVGRYTVHGPPPIPNVANGASGRIPTGAVIAIEPFATDGLGLVREQGVPEVFRLDPEAMLPPRLAIDAELLAALRELRGLPFARRQLASLPRERVETGLARLIGAGLLRGYAPLVESAGRPVAQAEHTLYVGEDGVEVLTRPA